MIPLDSEQYVKEAICQYLNENPQGDFPATKPENVITLRIFEDNIITLIDCGIKGTPKFTISADKLEFNPKPVEDEIIVLKTSDNVGINRSPAVVFPETVEDETPIEAAKKPIKRSPNGRRKRGKK